MLLKVKILLKGEPKNQLIGKNIYVYIYIYVTELLRYVGMPSQCRLFITPLARALIICPSFPWVLSKVNQLLFNAVHLPRSLNV